MSLWKYARDSSLSLAAFVTLLLITNCLLAVSTPLQQSLSDILYLDVLLLAAAGVFFMTGYFSWRRRYLAVFRALLQKAEPDLSLMSGDKLEVRLLRDVSALKDSLSHEKVLELEARIASLNDYITRWVHQIKMPLSICELILEAPENAGHISEELYLEIARIRFLANQVLYASRSYCFAGDLQVDEVDLQPLVREAVKRNAVFFYSKNIEVSTGRLDFSVLTDKMALSYMLDQLLHNASKYTAPDGKVEIEAGENEGEVRLLVRDNGMGIPQKDVDRIFDKGFTGDNGRKTAASTGMGLYFSKMMADSLGHRLSVRSEAGAFSEFCIEFFKFSDYFNVTKM